MPFPSTPFLQITTTRERDGASRVAAVGELDMAVAADLEAAAREFRDGARVLVLDLSAITFIDSTGISVLVRLHETMAADGGNLIVVASAQVWRVIELCGLTDTLSVHRA